MSGRAEFTVDWPMGVRGKYAGKPVPALTANFHLTPVVAASRSKRLRTVVARGALAAREQFGIAPCPAVRRHLHTTLLYGKRQRAKDADNLHVALKPAIDALVDAGWVWRDSPKWLIDVRDQEKSPDGVCRIRFVVSAVTADSAGSPTG